MIAARKPWRGIETLNASYTQLPTTIGKTPHSGDPFSKLSGEEVVMANEFIGLGPIVTGLTIKGASSLERGENFGTRSEALLQRLRATCEPPSEATIFLRHRGFRPVYADTDDQAGGCFWTNSGDGGGVGQLVLAPIDEREARIWVGVRFVVAPNGKTARLALEYDPGRMATE